MKRYAPLWTAVLGLLLLGGCFTTGRNFPSETDWLIKNTSSQEDVELMLGQPTAVGNASGVTTWTYGYYQYKLFGDASYKELKIYWNPNRTVQQYTFTSSFPTDVGGQGRQKPANASESKKPVEPKKKFR